MTVSSLSHPSRSSSSQHSSEASDTKTAIPASSPRRRPTPVSPTLTRLRNLPTGLTRPPTPIPLRPAAPPALRAHPKLPSTPISTDPNPANSTPPLRRTPKGSSPVCPQAKMGSLRGVSESTGHPRSRSERLPLNCTWNTVKTMGRKSAKDGLPLTPDSPRAPRGILLSRNGSISEGHSKTQSIISGDADSLILPSLDGDNKENNDADTIEPPTPNSSIFPPLVSDNSSTKSTKSHSVKSVRWAEISVFPEQQGLLNIHGLLKTLIEADQEIKDICTLLQDYLPQPGLLSERKYTLRSSQEEELEHALRILDGALYRTLDSAAVEKARKNLQRLAPIIQLRFATLPFHREVERLKAERLQLKEERALVLVQLAIQESEIKFAQLRREAERNREIEEAALRRMKRRDEKMREKQVYLGFRKLLGERSEELMELNQQIAMETQRLLAARQERDAKNTEKVQKGTAILKVGFGGSLRMTSVRQGDKIKCWI